MKTKQSMKQIEEDDERYTDFYILETLYEIGEKVVKNLDTLDHLHKIPERQQKTVWNYIKGGWTAKAISQHFLRREWGGGYDDKSLFKINDDKDDDSRLARFSVCVGTFRCEAYMEQVFGLIAKFEQIAGVGPKKQRRFNIAACNKWNNPNVE